MTCQKVDTFCSNSPENFSRLVSVPEIGIFSTPELPFEGDQGKNAFVFFYYSGFPFPLLRQNSQIHV